jgi:peptide/nickel transport system permease protein
MSGTRAWLLTDAPDSRRQAAWGRAYRGWLLFRRNKLAMAGLVTVIVLVDA